MLRCCCYVCWVAQLQLPAAVIAAAAAAVISLSSLCTAELVHIKHALLVRQTVFYLAHNLEKALLAIEHSLLGVGQAAKMNLHNSLKQA
jgi:hypothetical protein